MKPKKSVSFDPRQVPKDENEEEEVEGKSSLQLQSDVRKDAHPSQMCDIYVKHYIAMRKEVLETHIDALKQASESLYAFVTSVESIEEILDD